MTDHEADRRSSAVISVSRLPKDGLPVRFEAGASERSAIAERFGIVDVERFEADLVARRWQGEGVSIEGDLSATVVQADVVSLEPLRQDVSEPVRLLFVPEHSRLAAGDDAEIEVDPVEDAPETFRGDRLDFAEALTQVLGLALDPYPRAGGVEFAEVREGEKEPSPFAVLATRRDKKGG